MNTSLHHFSTIVHIITLRQQYSNNNKIWLQYFHDQRGCSIGWKKQTNMQARNIQKKKMVYIKISKYQQACQIKKDNWKYYQKTNIQHHNPKVMYTRYYLLRWHIQGDGSQVHFRVRLDAGQHEKKAYEQYVLSIRACMYSTRQQRRQVLLNHQWNDYQVCSYIQQLIDDQILTE